jgi:peptidoglycan/xylan/chitin deacetylase (PgdA/CDA1 family)
MDGEHDDESELFEQAYEEGRQPGKEDGTDCSGVRVPDRGGFNKRVALTFDDGPNPETTPKVIEVLKRHRAPATFFINGSKMSVAGASAIAKQIADDPDLILANHSQNHQNLGQADSAKVAREIDQTDALIRSTGEMPVYFRFPFGSSTCNTMKMARDRGYIVAGWHVDSADWCFAKDGGKCTYATFKHVPDSMRDDMNAYVMSQVRASGGGVLLFHDIHRYTADSLDGILTALEAEGFTFARLDDTSAFPRLHGLATRFVGDACMTDAQCVFMANGEAGRCHAAGFCTVGCEGSCPDLSGKAPTFCIRDGATATRGICVSKVAPQNQQCASLPGTMAREEERFVGSSSVSVTRANVCAPR